MSKTLEQYRTITKLLKLDILKVQLTNQQLQRKLGPTHTKTQEPPSSLQISSTDPLAILYNDMQMFSKSLQKIGLSPEMFFRLCDTKRTKVISVSEFVNWGNKLGLGMERGRVDRICLKLDEKKNGAVELNKYMKYVKAFQIGKEKGEEVVEQGLRKMAKHVKGNGLAFLDSDRKIDFQDFQKLVQREVKDIEEAELTAIFINFDVSHQFKIPTESIYKRLINLTDEPIDILKTPADSKPSSARDKKPVVFQEQPIVNQNENPNPPKNKPQDNRQNTEEINNILKKKKVDIGKVFPNLLGADRSNNTMPLQRTFTIKQFQTATQLTAPNISPHESKVIFKAVDKKGRGGITPLDLCNFYLANRPDKSYAPILSIIAYEVASTVDSAEAYLENNGLSVKDKIPFEKFDKLIGQYGLDEGDRKGLYDELRGKDSVLSGEKFVKSISQAIKSLVKTKPKKNVNVDSDS